MALFIPILKKNFQEWVGTGILYGLNLRLYDWRSNSSPCRIPCFFQAAGDAAHIGKDLRYLADGAGSQRSDAPMSLGCVLEKFHGDYSKLYTPNGGTLTHDARKGWKIARTSISSGAREEYFKQLISDLQNEPLENISNLESLIFRINQIWHKSTKCLNMKNNENGIYFNSKTSGYEYLSNFSQTLIVIDGELFPSAEHAYQKLKADIIDPRLALQIDLKKMSPLDVKKWGAACEDGAGFSSLDEKEAFNMKKLDLMQFVISKKFELNPVFREALMNTSPLNLVENTDSSFWGYGRDREGQNHLGFILEKERHLFEHW